MRVRRYISYLLQSITYLSQTLPWRMCATHGVRNRLYFFVAGLHPLPCTRGGGLGRGTDVQFPPHPGPLPRFAGEREQLARNISCFSSGIFTISLPPPPICGRRIDAALGEHQPASQRILAPICHSVARMLILRMGQHSPSAVAYPGLMLAAPAKSSEHQTPFCRSAQSKHYGFAQFANYSINSSLLPPSEPEQKRDTYHDN